MTPSSAQTGSVAEALAADYLTCCGYDIVARNVRFPEGEIDIIAYEAGVLCFVEVRSLSNPDHGNPLETIQRPKQRRVIRAAQRYLETLAAPWPAMRFDAVGVVLSDPPQLELVREAFEA